MTLVKTNQSEWDKAVWTAGFRCDICQSTRKTKMGQIPIGSNLTSTFIRWIICQKCHHRGWRPPSYSTPSYFKYKNIRTGEERISQFRQSVDLPYVPIYRE